MGMDASCCPGSRFCVALFLGFYAFLLSAAAVGAAAYWGVELLYVYRHFLQLALAALAFAAGLSAYLAVRAAGAPPAALAPASSGEQHAPALPLVYSVLFLFQSHHDE